MKNWMKNLSKRVVSCPSCSKRLRIPVRPGKTLRVSCPGCISKFEIQFKTPFSGSVFWDKKRSFSYNLNSLKLKALALPKKTKLMVIFLVGLIFATFLELAV